MSRVFVIIPNQDINLMVCYFYFSITVMEVLTDDTFVSHTKNLYVDNLGDYYTVPQMTEYHNSTLLYLHPSLLRNFVYYLLISELLPSCPLPVLHDHNI